MVGGAIVLGSEGFCGSSEGGKGNGGCGGGVVSGVDGTGLIVV